MTNLHWLQSSFHDSPTSLLFPDLSVQLTELTDSSPESPGNMTPPPPPPTLGAELVGLEVVGAGGKAPQNLLVQPGRRLSVHLQRLQSSCQVSPATLVTPFSSEPQRLLPDCGKELAATARQRAMQGLIISQSLELQ